MDGLMRAASKALKAALGDIAVFAMEKSTGGLVPPCVFLAAGKPEETALTHGRVMRTLPLDAQYFAPERENLGDMYRAAELMSGALREIGGAETVWRAQGLHWEIKDSVLHVYAEYRALVEAGATGFCEKGEPMETMVCRQALAERGAG